MSDERAQKPEAPGPGWKPDPGQAPIYLLKSGAEEIPVYEAARPSVPGESRSGHGYFCWCEALGSHVIAVTAPTTRQGAMTLVHEILHAIDDRYGFELEEPGVRALEQLLCESFARNPDLWRDVIDRMQLPR